MKRSTPEEFTLYPHQEEGVRRILHGFCTATYLNKSGVFRPTRSLLLHDDMGLGKFLGKTVQALEALRRIMSTERLQGYPRTPVLIVAPAACLHVWQKEIGARFAEHFTDVRLFVNASATLETLTNMTYQTVIITSYSTLRTAFQTCLFTHLAMGALSNAELARLCIVAGLDTGSVSKLAQDENRAELLLQTRKHWNAHVGKSVGSTKPAKTNGYAALVRTEYSCLIMDEIHTIKNVGSKACKAVAFVSARHRLGLSGTPTMNHGGEMLTILKHGLGLFDADWNQIYREPDGTYCRTLLTNVCFGRRKADVPELVHLLPTRDTAEDEQLVLDWSQDGQAQELYVAIRQHSVDALAEIRALRQRPDEARECYNVRRSETTQHFWTMFQKLRQVCLHPFLVLDAWENADVSLRIGYGPDTAFCFPAWLQRRYANQPTKIRNCILTAFVRCERYVIQPSAKMNCIADIIRRQAPKKVVVMSQFRVFLESILGPWLGRNGIGWTLFAGGPHANQQRALQVFHEDSAITVLLAVKSAGAQGLNLQAAAATVVITEPHFNDALDEQASQRVDRIGQPEKAVVIRKLFMQGSVDIALLTMQQKKTEITESWLGRNENALSLESVGLFLMTKDRVGKQ